MMISGDEDEEEEEFCCWKLSLPVFDGHSIDI